MSETDDLELVIGSGNVFADNSDPDAETKRMKATIGAEIIAALNGQALSAREGAKRAGVDAADIQRIRNADLARFTLDRLVRIAYRLGRKIELRIVPFDSAA
jgi:predicted XRE-type DNA-binding protein